MMGRISVAIALVCVTSGVAAAQSAEAEALFREGKKLVKAGKLAEGCAKLEASERVESSTGTLLNLGDCREQNHQLASAWAAFGKAAGSAKKDHDAKRESEARRRAKVLEPRLAKLVVAVKTPVADLEIKRDDQVIDSALWNTDVPVDAGSYKIAATAPGYTEWTIGVIAKDGETSKVEVPALEKAKVEEPESKPVAKTAPVTSDQPIVGHHTLSPTRDVAIGVAVVGLVGLTVGTVYGLKSRDLRSQADAICPMAACSDAHAVDLNMSAQTDAKRANIGFIVGGAATVGALVLWFTGAPKPEIMNVAIAPTANGFAIAGSF
jgi:hypothetical protein